MGICKFQGMLVRSGDKVHESFLFPSYKFWELISGPRDWLQMPLAVEPSHQTLNCMNYFSSLCVWASTCYDTSEEVRGQLRRVGPPLTPLHGFWGLKLKSSGFASLSTKLPSWLKCWYVFRSLKCTTTLTKWCQWRKKQIIPKMTVTMSNR